MTEEISLGGVPTHAMLGGLAVRLAYGLSNEWELGTCLRTVFGLGLRWPGATIGVQPGDLYADFYGVDGRLSLRWVPGVRRSLRLTRTRPIVGIEAGLGADLFTRRVLVSESGSVVAEPAPALRFHPAAGVLLGLEHRFRRSVILTGLVTLERGGGGATAGIAAELAWRWY